MLNIIWLSFFFLAFIAAVFQMVAMGNGEIWGALSLAVFDSAKLGFEIALGLTGLLCVWCGFFKVAEKSGLIARLARVLEPLFRHLMPEIPKGHPAMGAITMNLGANLLGLDNAATPLGLKAMQSLQTLNPIKTTASNAQILFLVLNTSSVTLLPVTIFLYRAQQGSANPAEVFIPILLATSASTLVGLLVVGSIQKLKLWHPVVLAYIGGYVMLLSSVGYWASSLSNTQLSYYSSMIGNAALFGIIIIFLLVGSIKKLTVYDVFISGAKQGFGVAVRIIPYLVAMLVAIGVFRASSALDFLLNGLKQLCASLGWDIRFVDALPTAFMKPLSGSGARAMMLETMNHHGVDSFAARLAAVMQGSTETTFYVLAVYFGSVGITRIRYALACGLIADGAGIATAIMISYWFFG